MRSPRGGSGTEHKIKGSYQSGQMGQTVNLLAYAFGGSNPSLPTRKKEKSRSELQIPEQVANTAPRGEG